MDYYYFLNVSPEESLHISISWTRKDGCENDPRTPTFGSDPHRLQLSAAGGCQLMVVRSDLFANLSEFHIYISKEYHIKLNVFLKDETMQKKTVS